MWPVMVMVPVTFASLMVLAASLTATLPAGVRRAWSTGKRTSAVRSMSRVVAVVRYRDGSVIDVIRQVKNSD